MDVKRTRGGAYRHFLFSLPELKHELLVVLQHLQQRGGLLLLLPEQRVRPSLLQLQLLAQAVVFFYDALRESAGLRDD